MESPRRGGAGRYQNGYAAAAGARAVITWDIVLLTIGFTLFVVLFLGPAMWSSDTEFLIVRLWRLYRQRTRRKELPEATPHAPETADGAPPSGDPPQL